MDLKKYFAPLFIWWWLIVLCMLLATGVAYLLVREQPPVYLSRTTLMIGRAILDPNPSENEFGLSVLLARTYADIAVREPVVGKTKLALGLTVLPKYTASARGQFLEIAVTDTDPQRAWLVANELANQVILSSPTGSEGDQTRETFISQQLDDLEVKISATIEEITTAQARLDTLTSAAEIANAQQIISGLETRLTTLQTNYANLLAGTKQGATNQLSVMEPAARPTIPIGPNKILVVGAAALAGALLAVGAAYLMEFIDDAVRTPEDITSELPYPIIGYIAEMGRSKGGRPYVAEKPFSMAAEAFRSLRTNLEFSSIDQALDTLLVTSAVASDGKTSVAANLAFVIAQGGKRVIVVDADMRQPSLFQHMGSLDRGGLSDIFRGQISIEEALQEVGDGVSAILSGSPPPNPAELLASKRMDQILATLRAQADIVIVDGPPFILADASILASKVSGVLVVARPGHTPRTAVRTLAQQVQRVGARVVGVALNRLPNQHAENYGGYRYIVNYRETLPLFNSGGGATARGREVLLNRLRELGNRLRPARKAPTPTALAAPAATPAPNGASALEAVEPAPESEAQEAQVQQLQEMSRALAESLTMPDLLQQVLPLALDTMGAVSGSIVLFDAEGGVAHGVFAYGGEVQPITEHQLADVVEHGLAGWVFRHRRATIIANTRDDPRWLSRRWDDQNEGTARSAASIPLLANNRVVGILTVVSPEVGKFNRTHLAVLTAIAVGITLKWYLTRPVSA